MTIIPEQSYTFFVAGCGAIAECVLHVDADSTLDSIRDEMVEANIRAARYGWVLAKNPNGSIAQACLNRDGTIRWDLLAEAIRKAEAGTNIDALVAYLEDTGEVTLDNFDDEYRGLYDSAANYVEGVSMDTGELAQVPARLRPYVNWDDVARDDERSGAIWTRETADGVHIFRS